MRSRREGGGETWLKRRTRKRRTKDKEKISEKVPGATSNAVTVEIGFAPPNPSKKISVFLSPGDPAPYAMGPRPITGRRRPRLDGPQKVTGRAVYTHDARKAGMLYASILRSPHAHAKIVSIDTSAAERLPGVVIENPKKDVVRYHGEAVLALAAPTRAARRGRPARREGGVRRPPPHREARPLSPRRARRARRSSSQARRGEAQRGRRARRRHGAADRERARPEDVGQGRRREGLRGSRRHAGGRHDDVRPDARPARDALPVRRVGRRHARSSGVDAGHVQREGRARRGLQALEGQGRREGRIHGRRVRREVRRAATTASSPRSSRRNPASPSSWSSTARRSTSRPATGPTRGTA